MRVQRLVRERRISTQERGQQMNGLESRANELVQPCNQPVQFLSRHLADSLPEAFDRQSADLTDLRPRTLGQLEAGQFQGEGEPRALGLAGNRHRYHSARAEVE